MKIIKKINTSAALALDASGAEILVHIGINTVETNGKGFTPLKEQGENVKVGDPIVKVNFDELSNQYDMSTMLIVTNSTDYAVTFTAPGDVQKGSVIGTFL